MYNIDGEKINTIPTAIVIAANDSSENDKANAMYVCDGTNDEVEIQSAINSLGANSGIIQLCNGTYNIDAFSLHDGYYYGLFFDHIKREVIIRGANHNHKSDNVSFSATGKAAVINVTSTAYQSLPSDKESYVIGGKHTYEFPYKVIGLESVTISLPDNKKPIIGVDGCFCSCMHVEHCFFKTDAAYDDDSEVNPKCVAVRGCGDGNIGYNYYMHHIKVIGWGTGFQVTGEHLQMIDCIAQRTVYGFVVGTCSYVPFGRSGNTGAHHNTLINCGAEYNSKGAIYFGLGRKNSISIKDFNMETGIGSDETWGSEFLFSAHDDSEFCGEITYAVLDNRTWTHVQKNAWDTVEHAKKFKTTDLIAPRMGTTKPTYPVVGSTFFNETTKKLLIFDGSKWYDMNGVES